MDNLMVYVNLHLNCFPRAAFNAQSHKQFTVSSHRRCLLAALSVSFRSVPFRPLSSYANGSLANGAYDVPHQMFAFTSTIIKSYQNLMWPGDVSASSLLTDHPAVCHSTFLCLLPGVSVYIGAAAVAFMRLHLSNCQMSCPQQDIAGKVVGLGTDAVRSCVTRFACQAGLCRCSTRINQKHVVAAFCAIRKWITWNEWMSVLWLRDNNKNNITKTVPVPDPVPGNSLQCGLGDKNGCLLI